MVIWPSNVAWQRWGLETEVLLIKEIKLRASCIHSRHSHQTLLPSSQHLFPTTKSHFYFKINFIIIEGGAGSSLAILRGQSWLCVWE